MCVRCWTVGRDTNLGTRTVPHTLSMAAWLIHNTAPCGDDDSVRPIVRWDDPNRALTIARLHEALASSDRDGHDQ